MSMRTWMFMIMFKRWASAILVRTSAIPQYCGQPNRLRTKKSCGTMIADLQNLTSAFCNFPQFPASSATFLFHFLSSRRSSPCSCSCPCRCWCTCPCRYQHKFLRGCTHSLLCKGRFTVFVYACICVLMVVHVHWCTKHDLVLNLVNDDVNEP
jgi:hypothetical protein